MFSLSNKFIPYKLICICNSLGFLKSYIFFVVLLVCIMMNSIFQTILIKFSCSATFCRTQIVIILEILTKTTKNWSKCFHQHLKTVRKGLSLQLLSGEGEGAVAPIPCPDLLYGIRSKARDKKPPDKRQPKL